MNDYGFIDYKKPIGIKDDMRTSTYRAHKYMTDTELGNVISYKMRPSKDYKADAELSKWNVSDYKANYDWKYLDPHDVRNPTMDGKILFIKPFDECKLRFIKRPIRPASSVSHQDYLWQPLKALPAPTPISLPSAVGTSKIVINPIQPGFAKYLDASATTNKLDYVGYKPSEVMHSIARHDNITYWNWKSKPSNPVLSEGMCEKVAAKECPKRRCEFPSVVKHVPHAGLTTEIRSNYQAPYKRVVEYDITHIRNNLVNSPVEPFPKKTEYTIYGSGKRTQNYV